MLSVELTWRPGQEWIRTSHCRGTWIVLRSDRTWRTKRTRRWRACSSEGSWKCEEACRGRKKRIDRKKSGGSEGGKLGDRSKHEWRTSGQVKEKSMGNEQSGPGGYPGEGKKDEKKEKKKYEPPAAPTRVGKKLRKHKGPDTSQKLPNVTPNTKCKLRLLKLERVKDYLLMEEEYVTNQERLKPLSERHEEDRSKVDDLRGTPMSVGSLEEIIDDKYVPHLSKRRTKNANLRLTKRFRSRE